MEDKIYNAVRYVQKNRGYGEIEEIKNDAANIFANSYEEYNEIWKHLDNL